MKNFNINANKIIRNKANSDKGRSYVLAVTGKNNLALFKEKIGFKHPNKIRELRLMVRSYDATSKNKKKFKKLKRELLIPLK